MLTRYFRFNTLYKPSIVPFPPLFILHLHPEQSSPPRSLPSLIPERYMFWIAKDGLLPSKRPSFTTRKLIFRRVKHICFGSEE